MKYTYDVIIIGTGSSGFSAAASAKKNGIQKILMIEKRSLGYSLCTDEGCMPSKTLLASAQAKHSIEHSGALGIKVAKPQVDWNAMQKRVRTLVDDDFHGSRAAMIKKSGIKVVKGSARFISPHEVQVGSKTYTAEKFVVATGSVPHIPRVKGIETVDILDSTDILFRKTVPKSLVIVGGGYISVELGYLYHALGVQVTILERGDHILARLDSDVGFTLQELMKKDGITIINNMSVNWVQQQGKEKIVCALLKKDKKEHCVFADEIFFATGRKPAIAGLDLEKAGVKIGECGEVVVDASLRTSQKHMYAAGDVNGKAPLVYTASMEGRIIGHNLAHNKQKKADYSLISNIIFSHPEIGTIGLTEKEVKEKKIPYVTVTTPMEDIGKAVALGETDGFVKLIAEKPSGKLLGLHILGVHATDIMQVALPHFYHHDTVFDIMNIPYPHPTLGEALAYPAEDIANMLSK